MKQGELKMNNFHYDSFGQDVENKKFHPIAQPLKVHYTVRFAIFYLLAVFVQAQSNNIAQNSEIFKNHVINIWILFT